MEDLINRKNKQARLAEKYHRLIFAARVRVEQPSALGIPYSFSKFRRVWHRLEARYQRELARRNGHASEAMIKFLEGVKRRQKERLHEREIEILTGTYYDKKQKRGK